MNFGNIFSTLRKMESRIREKRKEKKRSSEWKRVRDEHLERHPNCEACGSSKETQVHHIKPFHLHPELELEESNLMTLCMDRYDCHLAIGHGGSFTCYNPDVKNDVRRFAVSQGKESFKILNEIKAKRKKED